MKKALLTIGLLFSFAYSNISSAAEETISCTASQLTSLKADAGYRNLLSLGAYGFCIPTHCLDDIEPYQGKCAGLPKVSWVSSPNQSVVEGEFYVVMRASLSREASTSIDVPLNTAASIGSGFEIDPVAHFQSGSWISDPVFIHVHRLSSYQPSRKVSIKLLATSEVSSDSKEVSLTINSAFSSPQQSVTITALSGEDDQPNSLRLNFYEALSTIFPKKISVLIGETSVPVIVPTRATSVELPIPQSILSSQGVYTVSVPGFSGLPIQISLNIYEQRFADYPQSAVTAPCDGLQTVSREMTCVRGGSETVVDNSFCSPDPNPTLTYSSPAGDVVETLANELGSETFHCDVGSSVKQPMSVSCLATAYDTGSYQCELITYKGTYSDYPASNVTAPCSGTETVNKDLLECRQVHDDALVTNSLCTDQPSSMTYLSPAGSIDVTIPDGYKTVSCPMGSQVQTFVSATCTTSGFAYDAGLNICQDDGWPKGNDGDLSVPASTTYTISQSASYPSKVRIMNGATIVKDNVGSYVNSGDVVQSCMVDVGTLDIPSSSALVSDVSCKWLILGVKTSTTINGSLSASSRNPVGVTTVYTSRLPDGTGALTGTPISYTITQNPGASGVGINMFGIFGSGGAQMNGNGGGGASCSFGCSAGRSATDGAGGYAWNGDSCYVYNGSTSPLVAGGDAAAGCVVGGIGTSMGAGGGHRGSHGQSIYLKSKASIYGSGTIDVSGQKGSNGGLPLLSSQVVVAGAGGGAAGGSAGKIIISAPTNPDSIIKKVNGGDSGITSTIGGTTGTSTVTWPNPLHGAAGSAGTYEYIAP